MAIKLDTDTVKKLVSPTGSSDPLINAIFLTEYHRTLLRFTNFYQQLQSEFPSLNHDTNFSQYFELVKSFSKATQKKVLGHPSFSAWLDTAWRLINQKDHFLFPGIHIKVHLESFQKFLLAMALCDEIESFSCCIYTDHSGTVTIPGAGIYLQHPHNIALEKIHIVTNNGHFEIHTDGDQILDMLEKEIPHLKNGIELNSFDSNFKLAGRYNLNFEELTPTSIAKWLLSLEEAWFWIDSCSNFLASEMLIGIQSLSPIYSHATDVHKSQTFREIPGLLVLSWMSDTSVIVESLVHEYHHHKLNALLNLDPIIIGGSTEEIHYSPWRDDPRPLTGILQAIYVFQAVLEFWYNFLNKDIPVLKKKHLKKIVYATKKQLKTAIKILKNDAEFSEIGQALIQAIEENINKFDSEIPKKEQYSINSKLKEHRKKWESENSHLVSQK
ncbi:HEXXH motif-containing putative peptide modification protein [Spirulina sp. CCNP1310]|uniref:aKG-HExxH-type peptide beta-hydroxylase n=1 Tax=Spirulina sp. CCNP1310 TaxID=3110249 RepID=UPI002B203899|nr:HEXXH motif-containing putative peptide modification protein [Spirulina sp. CCNP1310]MEA5417689.1 HEXXH motif-containing putative peptide modification protein [Spirulina sp. CCNP1310]